MRKVFVLEGIDGCGKTSTCKAIAEKNKWTYLSTPMDSFKNINLIEELGDYPLSYCYFLSAVLYTSHQIKKNFNKTIICDRYYPTLQIYYASHGYNQNFVDFSKLEIDKPDKLIYLHVDYNTIKNRLKQKANLGVDERRILKEKSFYERLVKGYRKLCGIELNTTNLSLEEVISKVEKLLKM